MIEFKKTVNLFGIMLVVASTYPNYRVDRMKAWSSMDGVNFEFFGEYDNRWRKDVRSWYLLPVTEEKEPETRHLKIELYQELGGATEIRICELYILGKPAEKDNRGK